MKFTTLLLLLFIWSSPINAQISIEAKLIDAKTKEVIPYANVGAVELSKGTVSNAEGYFQLDVNAPDDQLTISSIGYETMVVKAKEISSVIQLNKMDYELKEIEVEAKRFGEKKLFGLKNEKRGHSIGFGSAQLGTEIGAVIRIEKPTYIKSANFVLNHAKGDSLLFRVNIYKIEDGKVGSNLLKENVLIKEKQRKGVISTDLTKYNLILESNVLLTLEWLRDFDEIGNKEITFDTKKSKKLKGTYVKFSSNGKFRKLPHQQKRKPCFYFLGKQSQ